MYQQETNPKELQIHMDGQNARDEWAKDLNENNTNLQIQEFKNRCGGELKNRARIVLDNDSRRQTVIMAKPYEGEEEAFSVNNEQIYIITRNGEILKIGGTRTSMKKRFGSYLCGHHVVERGRSGRMSVTNAHVYHTIEQDLLETDSTWEIYTWLLPITTITQNIFGEEVQIIAQTYHAYESCCINLFRSIKGTIPFLCDNSDPNY